MKMKIAPIIGIIICLAAAGGLVCLIFNKNTGTDTAKNNEIILFYGDTCPHCKAVEDFIRQNSVDLKLAITRKEVFKNSDNAKLLTKKAATCGITTKSIGVPLLWDGKTCYEGKEEVINFLITAANL